MGNQNKRLAYNFVSEKLTDEKLSGFPRVPTTNMVHDKNFRLDMQGLTTAKKGKPQCHNIQLQVNFGCCSSLKKIAPNTVVCILVPCDTDKTMTPEQIRSEMRKQIKEVRI